MKRKIFVSFTGLIIFLSCFTASVKIRDYFYRQNLKNNLQKVTVGTPDKEVIRILGRPNHVWSEDSAQVSWCYDTDSISHSLEEQPDIECGNMLLKMSSSKDGKVVKIFSF